MSISDAAGTARLFEASREVYSTAWIKGTKIWQVVYSVIFVAFVGYALLAVFHTFKGSALRVPRYDALIFPAVLVVAGVVIGVYMFWRSRQKYVLRVNGDELAVDARGEVYSLAGAQLGIWPNNGVALHLQSGNRRFVLGSRDRQIGPTTALDAEPIQVVDARLPVSDFDDLLRLGGRAAACGPAAGEPVRCILFPNAQAAGDNGPFAFRGKQRPVNSLGRAQLFIDVDRDTIRVVEPENHSVDASAAVARITATPLSYERTTDESSRLVKTPALALSVPGGPPLTVASALHTAVRFARTQSPHIVKEPPRYVLSAADWLTLLDTFGLAADAKEPTR